MLIQFVTIASTGNGMDFGDLNIREVYSWDCINSTRGIIVAGGYL